jgi:hypothetical protein
LSLLSRRRNGSFTADSFDRDRQASSIAVASVVNGDAGRVPDWQFRLCRRSEVKSCTPATAAAPNRVMTRAQRSRRPALRYSRPRRNGHATTDSRRLGIGSDHVQTVDGDLVARVVMLEGIATSGRSLAGPGRRSVPE